MCNCVKTYQSVAFSIRYRSSITDDKAIICYILLGYSMWKFKIGKTNFVFMNGWINSLMFLLIYKLINEGAHTNDEKDGRM